MSNGVELGPYGGFVSYLIRVLTPLHVGVGRIVGLVDLPVERDGFGLPTIPSSGIKGALRERFRGDPLETAIFGQKIQEAESHAGALTVLDACLVAIPVRSLKGVWALTTSSFMLRRLKEYIHCANISPGNVEKAIKALEGLTYNEAITSKKTKEAMEIDGKFIINEEFKLTVKESEDLMDLANILHIEEPHRLIGVHDDLVKPIVERSLLRRTRIRLISETKTVESGALWKEEDVPANAIFVTSIAYNKLRISDEMIEKLKVINEAKAVKEDAGKVREYVEKKLLKNDQGYLILGGHETVGRGLVKLFRLK